MYKGSLDPSPPCPHPEDFTETVLKAAMKERGLSINGTRSDWEDLYRHDDIRKLLVLVLKIKLQLI